MEILNLKKLTNMKWLNLFDLNYIHNGKQGSWQFVSRKSNPKFSQVESDAVVIVPILDNLLVVTKEFRFPIGDYELGFPAGLIDSGETVEEAACRELFEETGLKVTRFVKSSCPIISSAGLSDESVNMVFVECEGTPTNAGCENTEDIEIQLLDYDEVTNLVNTKDKKIGAKAWIVFLMFHWLGEISFPKADE